MQTQPCTKPKVWSLGDGCWLRSNSNSIALHSRHTTAHCQSAYNIIPDQPHLSHWMWQGITIMITWHSNLCSHSQRRKGKSRQIGWTYHERRFTAFRKHTTKVKYKHPAIICIWGQHTLSGPPQKTNWPLCLWLLIAGVKPDQTICPPSTDLSQSTGSTAAQPGAGGPSGSRWLSEKQTLTRGWEARKSWHHTPNKAQNTVEDAKSRQGSEEQQPHHQLAVVLVMSSFWTRARQALKPEPSLWGHH